jgi:hypothetical protein
MRVVKRDDKGDLVGQLLAGFCGAILTTLPSFIVMPLWAMFVSRYRMVDERGEDHNSACVLMCALAGAAVWVVAAIPAIAKGVE